MCKLILQAACSIIATGLSYVSVAGSPTVTLTISTALPTVGIGMPVIVKTVMTNISQTPISMRIPASYGIAVNDVNNQPANLTPWGRAAQSSFYRQSAKLTVLQPGQSNEQDLYISDRYDLSAAGSYIVRISGGLEGRAPMTSAESNILAISVKKGPRGDLNGDGIVDLKDLAIIQSALNTPAIRDPLTNEVKDARNLSASGTISAADARILVSLCTYANCASHL